MGGHKHAVHNALPESKYTVPGKSQDGPALDHVPTAVAREVTGSPARARRGKGQSLKETSVFQNKHRGDQSRKTYELSSEVRGRGPT